MDHGCRAVAGGNMDALAAGHAAFHRHHAKCRQHGSHSQRGHAGNGDLRRVSRAGHPGLRLDVYPFDYNTADTLTATLGRASNGNFVLSEFQAETDPEINIALNKPATATAALWPGFLPANIVDGHAGTIASLAYFFGTLGFTYEVDLGATYSLTRIAVKNRADGCCG